MPCQAGAGGALRTPFPTRHGPRATVQLGPIPGALKECRARHDREERRTPISEPGREILTESALARIRDSVRRGSRLRLRVAHPRCLPGAGRPPVAPRRMVPSGAAACSEQPPARRARPVTPGEMACPVGAARYRVAAPHRAAGARPALVAPHRAADARQHLAAAHRAADARQHLAAPHLAADARQHLAAPDPALRRRSLAVVVRASRSGWPPGP
jgi:hypothetical protein